MTKAKNIKVGDHIKQGKVTRVIDPGYGEPVEIEWRRGAASGVLIRSPGLSVKRVYDSWDSKRWGRRGKR
jgi:hypothetical protein